MHKLATVLLLTLATPAFAARQLTEITPILSEPQLSFEPATDAFTGPDGWKVRDYTRRAQALKAAARRREAMERLQRMVNPAATHRTFYTGRAPVLSNDGYSHYYHGEAR